VSPLRFYKLQGTGNDFVLLDAVAHSLPPDSCAHLAQRLCHRQLGVGADGLLIVESSLCADYRMRIYNADGSEATMCGNGIRCFARYLWEYHRPAENRLSIETGAGIRQVDRLRAEWFLVEMGTPQIAPAPFLLPAPNELVGKERMSVGEGLGLKASLVHTGAPHLVLFVDSADAFPLESLGPQLERHPQFPDRVNVSVAQVESPDWVRARVWERGAGATLACGTGACAILVAGVYTGRLARAAYVQMPGGVLEVEWRTDHTLWLAGNAELVFEGEWRTAL